MNASLELLLVALCLLLALAIVLRQVRRAVKRFDQPQAGFDPQQTGFDPPQGATCAGGCEGCPSSARCATGPAARERSEDR